MDFLTHIAELCKLDGRNYLTAVVLNQMRDTDPFDYLVKASDCSLKHKHANTNFCTQLQGSWTTWLKPLHCSLQQNLNTFFFN